MKKKTWIIVLIAVLCILLLGIEFISFATGGKVVYKNEYTGVSFEDELTEEELAAVKQILNGKVKHYMIIGAPSCGGSWDVAIIVNGKRYMLALDTCGTVFVGSKLIPYASFSYMDISNEEQDILEEIFTSRGGTFPCI